MKILMFGWEFPPQNSGGLGVACEGLTSALSKYNDIQIKFVLPRKIEISNDTAEFIFADSIGIEYVPVRSNLFNPYGTRSNEPGVSHMIEEVESYEKAGAEIAMDSDFDIIHAHDWLSFGAGIEAKKVSGKPLVVHVHATEFDRGGGVGINQYVYEKEKRGLEVADKIITVSAFTKEMVIEKYKIDPEKIEVVHNGLTVGDINQEEINEMSALHKIKEAGYSIILFLGRLTIQKNPETILRAASQIIEHNPKTIFVFAGSGDMEGELINKAVDLGISDKVIFTGFVRGNHKNKLYQMADVFIMPSISEPFGIVPLESLANGTPVIVSKQSGVAEVIAHALKVDFWDRSEIVNKVISLLRHGALKDTLVEHGTKEVKNVNWDVAAGKVKAVYDSLINN